VRNKYFWVAILGLSILAGIISCVASDSSGSTGRVPAIMPEAPGVNDDYQYYLDDVWDRHVYENGYENEEEDTIEDEYITIPATMIAPAELDFQTDNFFVARRYVGFLMWGYLSHPTIPEYVAVIDSSVLDSYTGETLLLSHIIDVNMINKALDLLADALVAYAPETEPFLYLIDEAWFDHVVLDTDGLLVMLEPDAAPWDLGFITVHISYEDLGEAFLLGVELGIKEPPRLPMVALTFDDGPSPYTSLILDLLERYGGRATFCVLGYRIASRPDVLRRAVELGSEVVGHSWDHANFTNLNASAIASQITRTSTAIEEAIGIVPPPIFRAPFGITNNRVITTSQELGYSILHWSVDPQDWNYRDADAIYELIMNRTIDGAIVLLHDIHPTTAEAMERVIPRLIEEGFQLVTASELIEYFYGELEPGETYQGLRLPWGS